MLIANNMVYENGGRCLQTYTVSNIWIVNNTCYKNGLDTIQNHGEFVTNNSKNGYLINNIARTWSTRAAYGHLNTVQNITYKKNLNFNGSQNFSPTDPTQFIAATRFSSLPRPSIIRKAVSTIPLCRPVN